MAAQDNGGSQGGSPWGGAGNTRPGGSGGAPPGGTGGGSGGGGWGGWGNGPGGPSGGPPGGPSGGPSGGGPWGGGGRRRGPPGMPPDLAALIARLQAWLRGRHPPGPGGNPRLLALGLLGVVALWLASGIYVVQPDQLGVVLRFGAFVGTTPPGLNYHLPWPIETVLRPAVTRINRTDVGFVAYSAETGGAVQVPEESHLLTGDENIVAVNATVFWRIRDPQEYLFQIRDPLQLVKQVTESSLREVIGLMALDPVLTSGRAAIEQAVLTTTQARLHSYHAGIEVTQVQLQRVDPPALVLPAFRDVQAAREDARRAVNQAESYRNNVVPRARGQAAQIVQTAEGAKSALIARATGAAKRFDSVETAYRAARQVTLERIYIETMEAVLGHASTLVVGDGLKGILPMLPLTQPTSTGPTSTGPQSIGPQSVSPSGTATGAGR